MVETVEEPGEHHPIEEFTNALGQLDDAGWARLRRMSRNWCQKNNRCQEEEDILQEAIMRVLRGEATGKRQWPKGINFFAFMSGVMMSIASERPRIGLRKNEDNDLEAAKDVACQATSAQGLLFEKEVQAHVMALFEGDEDAELMILAWSEDEEKKDILDQFDWDEKKHEAVRKRIKRKLGAHPELREMIHGE